MHHIISHHWSVHGVASPSSRKCGLTNGYARVELRVAFGFLNLSCHCWHYWVATLDFLGVNSFIGPRKNSAPLYDPAKMKLPYLAPILFPIPSMTLLLPPWATSVRFFRCCESFGRASAFPGCGAGTCAGHSSSTHASAMPRDLHVAAAYCYYHCWRRVPPPAPIRSSSTAPPRPRPWRVPGDGSANVER